MKGHLHRVNSVTCSRWLAASPCKWRRRETFCKPTWLRWRGQTEKIALLRPPPPNSDRKPFWRINWMEIPLCIRRPENSVYSISSRPSGIFFPTQGLMFLLCCLWKYWFEIWSIKRLGVSKSDDNEIENRLWAFEPTLRKLRCSWLWWRKADWGSVCLIV